MSGYVDSHAHAFESIGGQPIVIASPTVIGCSYKGHWWKWIQWSCWFLELVIIGHAND
jgi:hypothetical protein